MSERERECVHACVRACVCVCVCVLEGGWGCGGGGGGGGGGVERFEISGFYNWILWGGGGGGGEGWGGLKVLQLDFVILQFVRLSLYQDFRFGSYYTARICKRRRGRV